MKRFGSYRPLTPSQMAELEERVMRRDGRCYFADPKHRHPHHCEGRSWAAHLYPQARLKSYYRYGAWREPDKDHWHPIEPYTPERKDRIEKSLAEICSDDRNVVAMCDYMHGLFDRSVAARRACMEVLPAEFEHFYREYRLEPMVERHFGLKPFALDKDDEE